ncbi:MAG TPA: protein kinase [Bacteroidota bacterium]|jgi:serine/threonine protein kinase
MIGQTISHYKILEKLGEGGMGVVYKAEDLKLKRIVALKFLPQHLTSTEDLRARFQQEAQAAATLNHPNICTIHAIEEHDGQQFIDMEFVDGETMRNKLPIQRVGDAVSYAIQIGEALTEAHSKGIVHRDIKADNVMVNSKNQIKVMDFGLAKLKGSMKLTRASSTVGTLAYMAPEQISGGSVDARSDIFSFGVVLYEMLTGQTPFRGEHEAALVYSIVNEEPEPLTRYLPEAPSELLHVVNRALEKDPEERYQTVHDMVIDLRRLKKESTKVSRVMPVRPAQVSTASAPVAAALETPDTRPEDSSRKMLWAGLGAAAIVLAIGAYLFIFKRAEPPPPAAVNPNMTLRVLQIPFTQVNYPGLSPDGNWAAFPAVDPNGKWDVYFMNTAGGEARRVTTDSSLFTQQADVSPDGSQITYDRVDSKALKLASFVVSSLGGVSRKLAEGGVTPRWRPDGVRIGYLKIPVSASGTASGKQEIWSVRADGGDNKLEFVDTVSTLGRYSFSWSPDGGSIAWLRSYPEGYQEVFTRNLASGKEERLTSDKQNIDEVCWTRQNEIVFSSNKSGNTNLWLVPASGGNAVQLTKGGGPDIGMKVSTDGKKLLYLQQQQIGHIWTSNIDGSNARQVTFDDRQIGSATFSPDRSQILFDINDADPLKQTRSVNLMSRTGENRREITRGEGVTSNPQFSPDGKWILFLSRAESASRDSVGLYLIESENLGSPRFVGRGGRFVWLNAREFVLGTDSRSMRMSVDGSAPKQIFEDSTFAIPILKGTYILYADVHKARQGIWITPTPGLKSASSKPKKLFTFADQIALGPDGTFMLQIKDVGEIWKVTLPDGKQERIPATFPGASVASNLSISDDGKEIVYIDFRYSAKLVMIENLH